MNTLTAEELKQELAKLTNTHRELDHAIEKLEKAPGYDDVELHRLKKQKLSIKDKLFEVEQAISNAK